MKKVRAILILTFLLGGVYAHTLKAQGNVYVRGEVPTGSGNFMATVTVNLVNNNPSLTRFGIDHNGPLAANATVQFNITSTNPQAPNLQSLVGQGQQTRELIGLRIAHFPTQAGASYTYQINATFTPQGGGAVVNSTTPLTLILVNGSGGGGGGGGMWPRIKTPGSPLTGLRGSSTVLQPRFKRRNGVVEIVKNGIFHRYGFLNFQGGNSRRILRNYRNR